MKISQTANAIMLFMFLLAVVVFVNLGVSGINMVTLPWISIIILGLALSVVFGLYGRYILPIIFTRFGVKIPIGDGYVDEKYVIIKNIDTDTGVSSVAGFSVIKLIPTTPSVDLPDKEKDTLLKNVESLLLSLPADSEYCVRKALDPYLKKLIKRMEDRIVKLQAKVTMSSKQGSRNEAISTELSALMKEKERLLKSNPVTGLITVTVYATGKTEEEVKAKLRNLIEHIEMLSIQLQVTTRVLTWFDLYDFVEYRFMPKLVRVISDRL